MSNLYTIKDLEVPNSASKQLPTVRRLSNIAKKFVELLGFSTLAVFLSAGAAQAAFLYWGSTGLTTGSVSTCFLFAEDAMRSQNFQNVQRSQSEVTGSLGGVYAAITCVRTTPSVTAIVMAVGDDSNQTALVRKVLLSQISARILR
jgi:hypothetical protein